MRYRHVSLSFPSSGFRPMTHSLPTDAATNDRRDPPRASARLPLATLARLLIATSIGVVPTSAMALDLGWGPFTLTGFAKAEATWGTNRCDDCQLFPSENKQRIWADRLRYGASYGSEWDSVTLFQPYLTARFDLGKGWKLSGVLSQRWRDGKPDIPGFLYDRSVALSHEDWGRVQIGAMTTRSWSVADYPYGTNIGVADPWASSGAGYGLLTSALRYTSRKIDMFDGDLVLEGSYDDGKSGWNKNKPRFVELYAQYARGDLVIDAMYQDGRNGTPAAWGHGPFTGLTPFPDDDLKLGSSGQSIAMIMGRYQIDSRWEVSGGVRANRWSGAYARVTRSVAGEPDRWNEMFNVDWGCLGAMPSRCAIDNSGYAARSVDLMAGLRYRLGQWTAATGMVFLGEARTENPSERGQSNWALFNTARLEYDFRNGLTVYGMAGRVQFKQIGLSPMSMPANNAFGNVDSRIARSGNWLGAGAAYVF